MEELKLTLPVPTSINDLYVMQKRFNPKTRKYQYTGALILSDEGRIVKNKIQANARLQTNKQVWDYEKTKNIFVYQDTVIYFARRGRDDNNIYKLLNDSLQGIAYDNDSRVLTRTKKILYDTKNPRVEVTIKPVEFVGIFDNVEEYETFVVKCESCSRFRSGTCSILNDSINYTVREEVVDKVCNSYKEKKVKK